MTWKLEAALQLHLTTPFHTGTGTGLAGYLDAGTLLDHEGYPYIAGSTLKGRLRYYFDQLLPTLEPAQAQHAAIRTVLFGTQGIAGSLFFDNLLLSDSWRTLFNIVRQQSGDLRPLLTQPRANVTLSRLRGVALEQRLFTVETVPTHFTFTGAIHGVFAATGRTITVAGVALPRDLAFLVAACRSLTHLGGRKSRGLGRCQLYLAPMSIQVNGAPVNANQLLEALK